MGKFNDFVERMKKEKDGFAEVWESNRPRRDFINHIAKIRLEKGMTQNELAEKVGLHQSAIARFESGESNPALKTILKIVGALDQKLTTQSTFIEITDYQPAFVYNPKSESISIQEPALWLNMNKKETECNNLTCMG